MSAELIEQANAKAAYLDERCWFFEAELIRELVDALEAAQPAPQVPMTEADIALAMASVKDPMQWGHLKPQKVKALLIEYTSAIEAHHNIGAKP